MAEEIIYDLSLRLTNGFLHDEQVPGALLANQATPGVAGDTQIIGFSADEIITSGDLVVPRWAYFRNCDPTNKINIGPTSGGVIVPFIQLLPGEIACLPLYPAVVARGQSLVANCKLKKLILEL